MAVTKTKRLNNMNKTANNTDPILPVIRPTMASEGLALLLLGEEIEVQNETLTKFLSFIEKSQANIKVKYSKNKYNTGYTTISYLL